MPNIGDIAPDFELLDQDGHPVKLSQFRGKKVILFAFPKADTPGCTTQACGFRDAFPRVETNNAIVLGISPDAPKDLLKWKNKQKLPYTLLSDIDHKVLSEWNAWAEKKMFGKPYMGVLRSHWVMDEEGRVIDVQLQVSPEDSVSRALATVGG